MAKPKLVAGAVIDGFAIAECVHRGGMATLWSVTRPGIARRRPRRSILASRPRASIHYRCGMGFRVASDRR
jgi:hypothetical protein